MGGGHVAVRVHDGVARRGPGHPERGEQATFGEVLPRVAGCGRRHLAGHHVHDVVVRVAVPEPFRLGEVAGAADDLGPVERLRRSRRCRAGDAGAVGQEVPDGDFPGDVGVRQLEVREVLADRIVPFGSRPRPPACPAPPPSWPWWWMRWRTGCARPRARRCPVDARRTPGGRPPSRSAPPRWPVPGSPSPHGLADVGIQPGELRRLGPERRRQHRQEQEEERDSRRTEAGSVHVSFVVLTLLPLVADRSVHHRHDDAVAHAEGELRVALQGVDAREVEDDQVGGLARLQAP
jgi:hypothetical protein